jgi:hypothetical protein
MIMCNVLYFQGQNMEDHALTAGLYPSTQAEKILSNHSNKSRKETDGINPTVAQKVYEMDATNKFFH